MAKKITITSDARKKCDIKITKNGAIVFNKDYIVINDETEPNEKGKNPKSRDMLMMQVKIGNPDAEITED